MQSVIVNESILSKNDDDANKLAKRFDALNLFVCNLMSSPGSGKTSLLEALTHFSKNFAVIEGDLQTERDAQRLQSRGILARQITTGDICHLDAHMITQAFDSLYNDLQGKEFLFIENVGNLVCPASYNLGARLSVVLLSVTEGDDKILKYPTMFLRADCVLITKIDLLPHFEFSMQNIKRDLAQLGRHVPIFETSMKDMSSVGMFWDYLQQRRKDVFSNSF